MSKKLGATLVERGVEFRVWAPDARAVAVRFEGGEPSIALHPDAEKIFSGTAQRAAAGSRYRFAIDDAGPFPDPYSRFQPEGPHGPSMVVDPRAYGWRDAAWDGLDPLRQVVYELHVGTFTSEGTYESAARKLHQLCELGITSIELMPLAEFVGRFGWGYDGVNLFAPYHPYGTPSELRAFIDYAHELGLGVILDVVYNHFGAEGNYLAQFARAYFTDAHTNPWGESINYRVEAVRRLAIDNAAYWIEEYHFDGLRLDATQNIHDPEYPALFAQIAQAARAAAGGRRIVISGEDYLQRTSLLQAAGREAGGLDHLWNDDFHHSARVALTGDHSGYFASYRGHAQELVSSLKSGYLFQGQFDDSLKQPRGSPVFGEPRTSFVAFLQNHDQVANTLFGARLDRLTSPARLRALTAVLLLGPSTPLIFMGQEFNASTPFAYFADYAGAVAAQLWASRRKELDAFEAYKDPAAQAAVLDPCSELTVQRSTLNWVERDLHPESLALFRDLIALRIQDPVLSQRPQAPLDGAVLTEQAFLLRWRDDRSEDRLLLVNLGALVGTRAWAEPLLAPPPGRAWHLRWSSNELAYSGLGSSQPCQSTGWRLPAESASLLVAE